MRMVSQDGGAWAQTRGIIALNMRGEFRYENAYMSFAPFYALKMIILPRQARDKHTENSRTDRFLIGESSYVV